MTVETFPKGMATILKFEGGKDDDPRDPGGRTNQGVIQRVFTAWLKKNGKPNRDVFTMTNPERDAIYKQNYADKVHYDELPPGVDIVVFDGAVNSGVSQSIKWLQRALRISADGVMGDVTIQALNNDQDNDRLIADYCQRRLAFLRALKTFKTFGNGWTSRVNQLLKIGQALARGSVGPEVVWVPNMNKKANIVDAKAVPMKAVADYTASGGIVSTTLGSVQSTLEPLAGSAFVDHIIQGIIVAGVLCAAGGLAYGWYARRKTEELNDVLDLVASQANQAVNDNAELPPEVLQQYVDPNAKGSETGNIAPGTTTMSGRTAGDTEVRKVA